jgi:hypothetical protein
LLLAPAELKGCPMKITITIFCILIALILIGWLGLQIKPKSFPNHAERTPELKTIPLAKDLPAPVERFYKKVYGDNVPVIEQ